MSQPLWQSLQGPSPTLYIQVLLPQHLFLTTPELLLTEHHWASSLVHSSTLLTCLVQSPTAVRVFHKMFSN